MIEPDPPVHPLGSDADQMKVIDVGDLESLRKFASECLSGLSGTIVVDEGDTGAERLYVEVPPPGYPDGTPIRIKISSIVAINGGLRLSDAGRTMDYVLTVAPASNGPACLDFWLNLYKLTTINRQGVELTTGCPPECTELSNAVQDLVNACRIIAVSVKLDKELDEKRRADERAKREARELKSFRLRSRAEVARFQWLLTDSMARRTRRRFDQLSLLDAYRFLRQRPDRERIIAAILDLLLGYGALLQDDFQSEWTWRLFFGELKAARCLIRPLHSTPDWKYTDAIQLSF